MTQLLNCPVCGYKEIEGNTCPNCDTDLFLMRSLAELPASIPPVKADLNSTSVDASLRFSRTGWRVGVALLILILGIALGASGSFFFLQPSQLLNTTVYTPNSVLKNADSKPSPNKQDEPVKHPQQSSSIQYTVRASDSLSSIAERFYGNATLWAYLVKANPQLTGRENFLAIGEQLIIPSREEVCRGNF